MLFHYPTVETVGYGYIIPMDSKWCLFSILYPLFSFLHQLLLHRPPKKYTAKSPLKRSIFLAAFHQLFSFLHQLPHQPSSINYQQFINLSPTNYSPFSLLFSLLHQLLLNRPPSTVLHQRNTPLNLLSRGDYFLVAFHQLFSILSPLLPPPSTSSPSSSKETHG